MTEAAYDGITFAEAPYGSDLYAQAMRLREEILRKPLGLILSDEELADDALRRHFCAVAQGVLVGSLSFKVLGPHTLQLKQMAVTKRRQGHAIGSGLLAYAEAWAKVHGYGVIVLNVRIGAEEFYARFGYRFEGEPFEENTIPHIRMTKRLI